jgi:P4 family phage/plasmid primase-like protien
MSDNKHLVRQVPDLEGVQHRYIYRNGLWSLQSDRDIDRWLHAELQKILIALGERNKSTTKLFREAANDIMRNPAVCRSEPVIWDGHGKVPTLDGLIDPLTHAIEPCKPEHFATWRIPLHFDPAAKCPHWEQLLNDAFADMKEADRKITIELVQEVFGVALIDNKPKSLSRALVLFGPSDTGKSVFLKIVEALFGGVIATPFDQLEGAHGLQRFVARLPWVLGEAFNQSVWHLSASVKALISGDQVEINPKGFMAVSTKVRAPAFWATNHPPKFKESSSAMAERMIIVPMRRTFDRNNPVGVAAEARKRNPAWEPFDLIANTEMPGVLNWALIGLKRALERGHFVNTEVGKELLEESRKDSNVAASFVEECVELNTLRMVSTADFYAAFRQWWISEHGEKNIPSPTHVGLSLLALPEQRIAQNKAKFRKDNKRFYVGCELNPAGISFWEDERSTVLARGNDRHSMSSFGQELSVPVPDDFKKTEEWKRIEAKARAESEKKAG